MTEAVPGAPMGDAMVEAVPAPDPAAAPPPPAPAEATLLPREPRATSLAEARVIILDDDPTMRNAILAALKEAGCREVLRTGSGAEALREVARRRVDLVLCDWQMPAMDGLTFLRELRSSAFGTDVPVLMLTANDTPKDAWAARRHDIAGWLLKPISPQSVVAQAAAILGGVVPRVRENVLDRLLTRYEETLPEEVAKLQALVGEWDAEASSFRDRMEVVLRRMHQVKGQAGTMGYALLGQLAAIVHDTVRTAAEAPPQALGPHRAELTRLARVAASGMRLVADRKLRGEGGAAGAKMRGQLGEFADALRAKLEAETAGQAGGRRGAAAMPGGA